MDIYPLSKSFFRVLVNFADVRVINYQGCVVVNLEILFLYGEVVS